MSVCPSNFEGNQKNSSLITWVQKPASDAALFRLILQEQHRCALVSYWVKLSLDLMLQNVLRGAVSLFSTLISHQSLLELYFQTLLQSQAVLCSVLMQEYSSSRCDDLSQIVLGVIRLSLIPFEVLP